MGHKKPSTSDKQPDTPAFVHDLSRESEGIIQVIPEGLARQDKIVSLIVNDLRAPLGAMAGLLDLLLRDVEQSLRPDQIALAQQVLAINRGLMRSTERLFHFYGVRSFGLTPSSRFLSARQLVDDAVREALPLAQWHHVHLDNAVPENMRLYVDPVLMQEVLLELLVNATRASRPDGRVTVAAASDDKTDILSVQDQGVGIARKILPNLFIEGAVLTDRAHTDERRKRGTGLGLPLASRLVQAHGGTLVAESEEGKGSLLSIRLPTTRPRVLIVDDQKMDLDLLTHYLDPLHVTVVQAKSGPQAIVTLAEGARDIRRGVGFDLIVSDIYMPNMDGFALLQQIMSDPVTATIPVILLTGEESMAQRVKGFRMGAADFVLKPVKADEFRACVSRQLGCQFGALEA